jgi:DNA polymerase-3 subunit alpha
MRRALALVKPTLFEDIIALGALYRPGPMDNIPSFAARKWGREKPDYLHPMLEPILKPTYGVIIYQEQVMQIAQVLAGYSLGEADLLRRAMGKKIKAEMDAQRARFIDGARANGVKAEQAEFIFNLVDKFAGYGFNKSHAAAYALVAWQTAWLKTHHPAAFFAASMAYDIHLTDKLAVFVDDMRRLGMPLLGPCINASSADFTLEDVEGVPGVRYALGALKGVGEGAMDDIVRERTANGPFLSIDDFVNRIDPRALNRRQMEALAAAGAFDCFGLDRARVHAAAELLMAAAQRAADARVTGQASIFGSGLLGGDAVAEAVPLPDVKPWPLGERLVKEREAFGFWFAGHPVEAHAAVLAAMNVSTAAQALARRAPAGTRLGVKLAGLVEETRWRVPQGKGPDRRYMMADLTDQSGQWGATIFNAEAQAAVDAALAAGEPLLFDVELQWREGDETPRLTIQSARPLAALVRSARALLAIRLAPGADASLVPALAAWLPRGGRSVVEASVPFPGGGHAVIRLGSDFALPPGAEAEIAQLPGVAAAEVSAMTQPLRLVA